MEQFAQIITNNYKKVIGKQNIIKEHKTIKNVLFFKDIEKYHRDDFKSFDKLVSDILIKPEYFEQLKSITVSELIPQNRDVETFFQTNKINSFAPTQLPIPTNKYKTEYNTLQSTIITNNKNTSLNTSILKMLDYFNSCTFMSTDVFAKLDKSYCDIKIYKPKNGNIENIYLLDNRKQTSVSPSKLLFFCQITETVISSLQQMFDIPTNPKIDLVLYAVDSNKLFPDKKGVILSENNANSGDTIPKALDLHRPMIRLYRAEEIIKVLIHEVIHCTEFETKFNNPKHNFKVFNTKYNNTELLFAETITETVAEFINCVLYSVIHQKDLQTVMTNELDFGLLQTAKILNHYGFASLREFIDSKNKRIEQATAVFEYHILKTVLFYKFEQFLALLKTGTAKDMMNLITNTMYNEYMYEHYIDNHLQNLSTLSDADKQTFRMTKTEICTLDTIPTKIMNGGGNYIEYAKYKQKYLNLKHKDLKRR